jgi:hypothetical protein
VRLAAVEQQDVAAELEQLERGDEPRDPSPDHDDVRGLHLRVDIES